MGERHQHWTFLEKMRVVLEAHRCGPERVDELLRREGLTRAQLEGFKAEIRQRLARAAPKRRR